MTKTILIAAAAAVFLAGCASSNLTPYQLKLRQEQNYKAMAKPSLWTRPGK